MSFEPLCAFSKTIQFIIVKVQNTKYQIMITQFPFVYFRAKYSFPAWNDL